MVCIKLRINGPSSRNRKWSSNDLLLLLAKEVVPPIWSTMEDKRLFRRLHSTIFTPRLRALFHKQHNYNRNYRPSRHNSIFSSWSPLELEFLVPTINKASAISKKLPVLLDLSPFTKCDKRQCENDSFPNTAYKCKNVKINSLSIYHHFTAFLQPVRTKIFTIIRPKQPFRIF